MKEQNLFILCGEAFSGKSTLAKKIAEYHECNIVGRDQIYFATEKILALETTPEEDDDSLWNNLWPIVLQGTKNHLLLGNSVVIDDNCLYVKQRDELRAIAKELGVKSILIYLDIPKELLKERKRENKISKTRHDVPSAWMDEDSQFFERPMESENPIIYTPDVTFEIFMTKRK
jgi:predicted kinase